MKITITKGNSQVPTSVKVHGCPVVFEDDYDYEYDEGLHLESVIKFIETIASYDLSEDRGDFIVEYVDAPYSQTLGDEIKAKQAALIASHGGIDGYLNWLMAAMKRDMAASMNTFSTLTNIGVTENEPEESTKS